MPYNRGDRGATRFGRNLPKQDQRPKIILAFEGIETEPRYFEELVNIERVYAAINVVFAPHRGTDPVTIIKTAIEARREEQKRKVWKPGDSVWAVYDGDEHRSDAKSEELWKRALDLARRSNPPINLAISNPCMEFWFLLHFEDSFAPIDRSKVRSRLETYITGYEKSLSIYENHLRPHTRKAIARAEQLDKFAADAGKPPHENPCTSLAALVTTLLKSTE